MNSGYIYILSNPSFKNALLKVGKTSRTPQDRLSELNKQTGVPLKYELEFVEFVPDCHLAEKLLHEKLDKYRSNKEFFQVPVDIAISEARNVADLLRRDQNKNLLERQNKSISEKGEKIYEAEIVLDEKQEIEISNIRSFYTQEQIILCSKCNKKYSVTFRRHDNISVCPYCQSSTDVKLEWLDTYSEATEITETAAGPVDDGWENRVLCRDGNCIGVIGPGGLCKECGKLFE